jgi:heme exporter protein C
MIASGPAWLSRNQLVISGLMVGLLLMALFMIFAFLPEEGLNRDVARVAYLYVTVAWCGIVAFVFVGSVGVLYLFRRELRWDHWSQAAAESGWLCTTLTLLTGVMWAHETTDQWWVWDPRLTVSLILWTLYGGYFLLRAGLSDPHRRARVSAVMGILSVVDIPLVVLSTQWFWGVMPMVGEAALQVRLVLLVSVAGFTAFFVFLTMQRRWQLALEQQVAALEWRAGATLAHRDGREVHASEF